MANEVKKILAIAVMRDGKVVTKLLPGGKEIRLGSGYNNNIAVEAPGLPESILFLKTGTDKDTWDLRLTDTMDAQITSVNGSKIKFSDLKGLGIFSTDEDGNFVLKVNYGDQGVVTAGPFVIHFGFIDPPKIAEKKPEQKKKAVVKKPDAPFVPDKRMLKLNIEGTGNRSEVFPNAGIMTIGQADYNTISVKDKNLPRIHTLLEPEQGNKYILRLLPEIKGGVEVKGNVIPFSTLIERNLLKQEKPGEPYIWVFDRNVSGLFTLGNTEIFFSFAEPPVAVAKPKPKKVFKKRPKHVPAVYNWNSFAARPHETEDCLGSRNEDGKFKIMLGIGLAAALLMGAVTDRLITVVKESKTQMLRTAPSARVAQLSETPPAVEAGMGEEIIDMPVSDMAVSGGGTGGSTDAPAGGGAAAGADAAGDVLSSIGFATYGTGSAGGSGGILGDLQSAASSGLGLSSGQSGDALVAGAGGGGSGGLAGLAGGGGGGVAASAETVSSGDMAAAHQAAQVTFSASASGEAIDLGYRNMSQIRSKINVIKMRVQSAYESLLRSNPGASGTITINFSITPGGSVSGVSVSCPSSLSALQGTVTSAIQGLNFGPAPEQTANLPVTIPFSLVPPQ